MVDYQPLTFNRWYVYPAWAYTLGWLMALSSMILIPALTLIKLATVSGTFPEVKGRFCRGF